MRANAYIDGFNLYYRAVRGTPYKWLNIRLMCELLVPEHTLEQIKYFTAYVSGKDDPDKPNRQQAYLRALKTVGCEIYPGKFLSHPAPMRLAADPTTTVSVIKTEEKGSDVNLASHLLIDGFEHRYDVALVVTNDSDLSTPVQYVRDQLKLTVIIINPDETKTSQMLALAASELRQLRTGVLTAAQFPDPLHHAKGIICKPSTW